MALGAVAPGQPPSSTQEGSLGVRAGRAWGNGSGAKIPSLTTIPGAPTETSPSLTLVGGSLWQRLSMATRLCARTAIWGRSTGGGSDPLKLPARWTVGGEAGRGRRGGGWGEGRRHSSAHFLLVACIFCCLHGPLLWRHSDPSCHLPIPLLHMLLFIQGLVLEHP